MPQAYSAAGASSTWPTAGSLVILPGAGLIMHMRRRWAMWLAMAAAACGDDATGTDGGGTAMPATETGSGSGPGSDSGPGPGSESGPGSDSSGSASETGGSLDGTSEGSTAAATDDASGSSS